MGKKRERGLEALNELEKELNATRREGTRELRLSKRAKADILEMARVRKVSVQDLIEKLRPEFKKFMEAVETIHSTELPVDYETAVLQSRSPKDTLH